MTRLVWIVAAIVAAAGAAPLIVRELASQERRRVDNRLLDMAMVVAPYIALVVLFVAVWRLI